MSSNSSFAYLSEVWGTPSGPRNPSSKKTRKKQQQQQQQGSTASSDITNTSAPAACALDRVMDVYTLEGPYGVASSSKCAEGSPIPSPQFPTALESMPQCYSDDVYEDPECHVGVSRDYPPDNCRVASPMPTKTLMTNPNQSNEILSNSSAQGQKRVPQKDTQEEDYQGKRMQMETFVQREPQYIPQPVPPPFPLVPASKSQSQHDFQLGQGQQLGQDFKMRGDFQGDFQGDMQPHTPPQSQSFNNHRHHSDLRPEYIRRGLPEYDADRRCSPSSRASAVGRETQGTQGSQGHQGHQRAHGTHITHHGDTNTTTRRTHVNTASFFYEMFIYIVSGILLIFIMDQMVKLGASLRAGNLQSASP